MDVIKYHKFRARPMYTSLTIPNEAYTIRELFDRAVVNSLPEHIEKHAYAEDTDCNIDDLFKKRIVDVDRLDKCDLEEYMHEVNDVIEQGRKNNMI